jgi:hypothetical protein
VIGNLTDKERELLQKRFSISPTGRTQTSESNLMRRPGETNLDLGIRVHDEFEKNLIGTAEQLLPGDGGEMGGEYDNNPPDEEES